MKNIEGEYFFLNRDCLLVTGAVGAAIYQLTTGNVFSIDSSGREAIEMAELGTPISLIPNHDQSETEFADFWRQLEAQHLGSFCHSPVPPLKVTQLPVRGGLQKIWLEILEGCNLKCVHCYADSSPQR